MIAMPFTDEVNCTLIDFIVAGALLIGTGLLCNLTIRKINKIQHRGYSVPRYSDNIADNLAELAVGILN